MDRRIAMSLGWCAVAIIATGIGCATSGPGGAPAAGGTSGTAGDGPRPYLCKDGRGGFLEWLNGKETVRLGLNDGREALLKRIPGPSGTYGDGTVTLTFANEGFSVQFTTGRAPLESCVLR